MPEAPVEEQQGSVRERLGSETGVQIAPRGRAPRPQPAEQKTGKKRPGSDDGKQHHSDPCSGDDGRDSSLSTEMTMSEPAVDNSGEHELVAIASELERYWSEQWRRAKEICDLLEQRLASRTAVVTPRLRLVTPADAAPVDSDGESRRASLKLVDR